MTDFITAKARWDRRSTLYGPFKTACEEIYNPNKNTAAHNTLPCGTAVRVIHLATGKSTEVIINDRGPFKGGVDIELTEAAAKEIGILDGKVADVILEVLGNLNLTIPTTES